MTIIGECRKGTNIKPVQVEFPHGELVIERNEPCPGCVWRAIIDFTLNEAYEQQIQANLRLTQVPQSERLALLAYLKQKTLARQQSEAGKLFSWENLQITRYPNLDNKVNCMIKGKNTRKINK